MNKSNNQFDDWFVGPNYKLIKPIGKGSYGQVCSAIHIPTGEEVAIKRVPNLFANLGDTHRVLRELSILTQLKQDGVAKIKDLIYEGEDLENFTTVYLVMQKGQSDLGKMINSKLYLSIKQIVLIMYNLLKSVHQMHQVGIIHRDIKPANVLINDDCTIQLTDFNLSRSTRKIDNLLSKVLDRDQLLKTKKQDTSKYSLSSVETSDDFKPQSFDKTPEWTDSDKNLKRQSNFNLENQMVKEIQKTKTKLNKRPRQMSWHTGTRSYRSPELVLMYKYYGPEFDIWSVGCIFSELLQMLKENRISSKNRKPLCWATSCFPMSPGPNLEPKDNGNPVIDKCDQLNQILQVTGYPSKLDTCFISDENSLEYLDSVVEDNKVSKIDLQQKYPGTPSDVIQLLEQLLQFNPGLRPTAGEAMQNNIFKKYYSKDHLMEKKTELRIAVDAEQDEDSLTRDLVRGYFIELYLQFQQNRV